MKNTNLYNKYRPKNFQTIVGQDVIKTLLLNSLKSDKFIQSYLFFGPHGTGKTSLARIYAKGLNCENFDDDVCDKCESCRLINDKKTLDIVEIDAASNNGVEFIRELVSSTEYLPINLNKKIYIIDEAHSLSSQSWNSLLKIIEEPPSHIVFMFLTTQEKKILPTILSRCQKLKFSFLNSTSLNHLTNEVAKKESKTINPDVVQKVVNMSQGSARELLTILDTLFLQETNSIELNHYKNAFSFVSDEKILDFIEMILNGQKSESFNFIDQFYLSGCNLINLMEETFQILLELSMFKITSNIKILKKISSSDIDRFQKYESNYLNCCVSVKNAWQSLDINKNQVLQIKSFLVLFFSQQNAPNIYTKNINVESHITKTTKSTQDINLKNKKDNEIKQTIQKEVKTKKNHEKAPVTNDKKYTFNFNTVGIYPENIGEYLNGNIPQTTNVKIDVSAVVYTLQVCFKYKEMSKILYNNLTEYLKNNNEMCNLFISWNKKYELIASDNTIVIAFDDSKYANIFNKKYKEIDIQNKLQEAISQDTNYSWYAVPTSKLSEYKKQSKINATKNSDVLSQENKATSKEKVDNFNKFLDMLSV